MDKRSEALERDGIVFETDGEECVFFVSGELDHHSVRDIREQIDEVLAERRPERVVLDLQGVTFTDSAGLGLILGRYTRIKDSGGSLRLINVPPRFMKILTMSGAQRLFEIRPAEKKERN